MARQPFAYLWMLVGGVVFDDGVDRLALGDLRFDGVEETNELLVPMAFHVASDDSAVEDIECSKQRGGSMTFVVVGHCPGAAGAPRKPGLGTVEDLDLALLVNGEDDRWAGGST